MLQCYLVVITPLEKWGVKKLPTNSTIGVTVEGFVNRRELLDRLGTSRRIFVTGRPGVGKSTLASELGNKLGLPVICLDEFIPECCFRDRPEWLSHRLKTLDSYIIEGCDAARMLGSGMWPDVVVWVERDVPVFPRHRGLATTVRKCLEDYPGEMIRYST